MIKFLWGMFVFFVTWFALGVVALNLFDSVIIGGIVGFFVALWAASKV
jgi:hypothetical protein